MSLKDITDAIELAVAVFRDYPVAALMLPVMGFLVGLLLQGKVDAGEIEGSKPKSTG